LAVQSGQNIVSGKDVQGNVTVSLNKVSIDEAMDYVAKLSGYGYAKDNGTYLVGSKESLGYLSGSPSSKPMVQVASVAYANPDDMVQIVKAQFPSLQVSKVSKALPDSGSEKASSDQRMASSADSKLVFTGDAAAVAAAQAVVTQVDESMKGQLVGQKSEVYRVKYVKPQDLARTLSALIPGVTVYGAPQDGFDLQGPSAITLSTAGATVGGGAAASKLDLGDAVKSSDSKDASSANFDPKSKTRTVIIVGRAEDVAKALELAAAIDVRSPQIKIDAKITSITKSGEKQLGLSWEWDQIAFFETGTEAWKRGATNFAATLDALIKNGNGQLLASPTLVCLEGKPGVFFVGDEVTYIQRIEVTPTGQNITTDTKQVGVQLRVNGTANLDGYVTLNLHPEVSVIKLTTQQGITLPIVTRRFTDHVVRVKDGQTIVIGGLIRSEDLEEMRKVPLLGDIPLLGQLFRHRETTKDHTEVVMFITATVLKD
jgi:type II secretory pathway component GspD/PulD (secretin)